MIISASRRTDLPAFHTVWFIDRVRAGYCRVKNPVSGRPYLVSLRPEDVDTFVFWSKDPRPLLPYLGELDRRGYRYYFQFTLNDYPDGFEPGIPSLTERLNTFYALVNKLGPERVIWRYDPIILSSLTPPDWHRQRFAALAAALGSHTRRVVVSVLDDYAPARWRLSILTAKEGFHLEKDPLKTPALPGLLAAMAQCARDNGLEIQTCAEESALARSGIAPGACVDTALINRLWGLNLRYRKDPSQRAACLCTTSRDIGAHDTCSHGCVYCYAWRKSAGVPL
jgi:hypothetical protein